MSFTYWGAPLPVYRHLYNCTWLNERGAELAVWQHWRCDLPTLEVGNVLNHYEPFPHHVVDRYEDGIGVERIDVFDIAGRWEQIVAISTIEHVRWDYEETREDGGALAALHHLRGCLAPGGRMLVTIPTGWNPPLDEALVAGVGAAKACTLVRDMDSWRQTDEVEARPYGLTQPWAEGVWIGEFECAS